MRLAYYRNCLKYVDQSGYVALDNASGGYPYPVSIDKAHDFSSQDRATEYAAMGGMDKVVFVSVRCTFSDEE